VGFLHWIMQWSPQSEASERENSIKQRVAETIGHSFV
jgi:hypothetical protein